MIKVVKAIDNFNLFCYFKQYGFQMIMLHYIYFNVSKELGEKTEMSYFVFIGLIAWDPQHS